jgi:GntR family transcriptional regulator
VTGHLALFIVPDLDPDSVTPLYEQLAAVLRDEIDAGRITSRLPSELSLVQEYGVSRGTVRRAVARLIEAGYARVSRGRGTFIIRR